MKTELFVQNDMKYLYDIRPDGWGDLVVHHQYYLSHSFCRTIKIASAGKPVAIGTAITHRNTAWLAHIIVHREWRGKGLGNQIVEELLSDLNCHRQIRTVSLIATELGYPLYMKKGFVQQTEYHFYDLPRIGSLNLSLSPLITPYKSFMEHDLLKLDKAVSGEDRSEYLKGRLGESLVYMECGRLRGFSIPELGDGLIIADNERTGIELQKLIMNRGRRIVIPRENLAAGNFLIKQGYVRGKIARRMTFGPSFRWEPENMYNRIGGNLG